MSKNKFNIKKQLSGMYASSVLGNLSLTGAWVAILAARGYSLTEIGIAETVFHITSIILEIPSGAMADVFGRKKMLIVSSVMRMIGNIIMILSHDLFTVCLSIAFQAMSYNFSSGTDYALAYDSLKSAGREEDFDRYLSNQMIIYRVFNGISTLCAGFALFIGHRTAYAADLITGAVQIAVLSSLTEFRGMDTDGKTPLGSLIKCFKESLGFLKKEKKAVRLMLCNSLVGAADILLLFFLQAKLPEKGVPSWGLGAVLLFMELGGVLGAKLILKFPKQGYKRVFAVTAALAALGIAAEHSPLWAAVALGGFTAAAADDALQVRTNALLQDMFPSEQRAALTSAESFAFSAVMIVLSPLAGFAFTYW
ncbi:MAG: MFS transporter [Ruminococcus sp.]|nr:MFS transporter [Ruminococcus sp.]